VDVKSNIGIVEGGGRREVEGGARQDGLEGGARWEV
jgi:hypothetical protein